MKRKKINFEKVLIFIGLFCILGLLISSSLVLNDSMDDVIDNITNPTPNEDETPGDENTDCNYVYKYNDNQCWLECEDCGTKDESSIENHMMVDFAHAQLIYKAQNCSEKDIYGFVCILGCGYYEEREVTTIIDCTYVESIKDGVTTYTCKYCGDSYTE